MDVAIIGAGNVGSALDAGPLRLARALEAMGFLHISLQLRHDGTWESAWKLVGPVPGV